MAMRRKLKHDSRGFTVIELLVSVSIIALVTVVYIADYRSADRQAALSMAAQKLASDIRQVQNYSLGSKEFGGLLPPGGWGINIDRTADEHSYNLFVDMDSDQNYDSGGGELVEKIELGSKIAIVSTSAGNTVDIVFFPPDPLTYINKSTSTSLEINLKETASGNIKKIFVNYLGLIDVD